MSLHSQIAVNHAQSANMHRLITQQMVHDFSPLAFKLVVKRDNLVQDTLNSLVSADPYNYKKPLQVHRGIGVVSVYWLLMYYLSSACTCIYMYLSVTHIHLHLNHMHVHICVHLHTNLLSQHNQHYFSAVMCV